MPAILPGLAALAPTFDALILDLWGVVHDGQQVFAWVPGTLRRLKEAGKRVLLLSNAPRREAVVARRNAEIGVDPVLVEGIVTSGEEAWRHMAERPDAFHQKLGDRCLHLGGPRDRSMREGLPYSFVDTPEAATCILNTGSAETDGSTAAQEDVLRRAAERDLPMVCANPDRVVIAGGRREPCAGAIADAYEALGGRVAWHGKPFPGVYARALTRLDHPAPARVLCIGDAMETDMKGAAAAGLPALFIFGGIHHADIMRTSDIGPAIDRLATAHGVAPVAALERFLW
ncbi:MAG TPA: TIGR01459 family HAD-type hydrolase [Kiloniellales bacterium]|nr:TIGR01459 family HAD-type hydrolase [Kiloniellales bacterium]